MTEYSLIPDSGGAGAHSGGLGICRRFEILKDGVQYAQYGDRFRFQPEGLFGGDPGARASVTIERDGEIIPVNSKDSAILRKGDVLTLFTGGGAGYGEPSDRARQRISDDLRQGFISPKTAAEIYGFDLEAAE